MPACEGAFINSTQTVLGPLLNWTLNENCRECADLRDVNRFVAIAVEGENLVMYDRNYFEHDSALRAW